MFNRTVIVRTWLVAVAAGMVGSSALAEEPVELKAQFPAGRVAYVETDSEVEAKSTSPMGNFDMTLRVKSGLLEEVKPHEKGVRLTLTIERAAFGFDSTMGPSFYDSDLPDEEESAQWRQILAPQIGMTYDIELDGHNQITRCTGMDAIVKKIDGTAKDNMFWTMDRPRYTDEHTSKRWHNRALSIFPDRPVKQGDTWTAPYIEEQAELKDFTFDCTYRLEDIVEQDGRKLAHISFTGLVSSDRKYECDGMMPVANIKVDKAELSGSAMIDVERGWLVRREDRAEIAFSGTMGQGDNAPKTTTSRTIRRTYVVKQPTDRHAEKLENDRLAAAKNKEREKASAERRRRFASAVDVDVVTAMRDNPIGVAASWPQWGGPHGDFKSDSINLAESWPDSGPKRLWSRDLGDGYSAIAYDGKRLYTMYRPTDEDKNKTHELVVALDPESGKTVWEVKYAAEFVDGMDASFGRGPHSTPLIVGDRLFTIGSMVLLHCLDKHTGNVIWKRDLHKDFNASPMMYGYGASALAYKDTIILPIGGEGQAVVALKQSDGSVAWKNQDFGPTHASPFIVQVGDVEQLILFAAAEVAGLDPNDGKLYWRIEHPTEWGANISTPVWGEDGTLFVSSAYSMGSRGIQLTMAGGKPYAKELWHNKKMKIHHGNAVRVGNFVYGSSGDFGAVFYAAVDVKSGELAWKSREIGKATSVYADGKMIILDEDGQLFLAKPSPAELKILGQVRLGDGRTWTVPTLVGTRLFVRDRQIIMALELG